MKRRNMNFSKNDAAVTFIVVILASILFYFFWMDLNNIEFLGKKDSLGTIEFRRGSATRKSSSSLNWNRLNTSSPVYNRDVIRTAKLSEAVLNFNDDSSLELFENSMIKLNFPEDAPGEIEFTDGRMTLVGGEGKVVQAGDRKIVFSGETLVSLHGEKEHIAIEVDGGSAEISNTMGEKVTLNPSDEFILNRETGTSQTITHPIDLIYPTPNGRLINLEEDLAPIEYTWSGEISPDMNLTLEVASHLDFRDAQAYPVSGETATIPQVAGIWYWRIVNKDEVLSSVSRYSLKKDELPRLIKPEAGQNFTFRTVEPAIFLSWSPMLNASTYTVEISDREDFSNNIRRKKTTLTSMTVNDLAEGIWYYRIIPELSQEIVSPISPKEQRSFSIVKSDAMRPLSLFYPVENTLYELKTLTQKGITLSWESHPEAIAYEVGLTEEGATEDPELTLSTEDSYLSLNATNASHLTEQGEYSWLVRWIDTEGNRSPWSIPRTLSGVDGTMAIRLSYPPDEYRIADSLIQNIRFTWKTNIPGRKVFQLSQTKDFTSINIEQEVQAETLMGGDWPVGKWYWRIRTFNADGTLFIETEPRTIEIIDPLPAPLLKYPDPEQVYIYQEGDQTTLAWQEIKGTDFYNIKMTPTGSSQTIYEMGLIEENKIMISLDDFPDGDYQIQIQGFANETSQSTRIIGYLSNTALSLYRLRPAELLSPIHNPHIKGLDALRRGILLKWDAPDIPEDSELTVYSRSTGRAVYTKTNPAKEILVPALGNGRYSWTLKGSLRGFDISAPGYGYFTVDPIPLLNTPQVLEPQEGYSLGPEQLRISRELRFDWEPLEGANRYKAEIRRKGNGEILYSTGLIRQTEFILEDVSILDKGEFEWTLHGEYRNSKGIIEQNGEYGKFHFSIDLPNIDKLNLNQGDVYFGY
jgi:hypothetical protein